MDTSAKALQEAISVRQQIDTLEKRLSSILGGLPVSSATRGGRRRMSAATRAKLAGVARARWAARRMGAKKKKSGDIPTTNPGSKYR